MKVAMGLEGRDELQVLGRGAVLSKRGGAVVGAQGAHERNMGACAVRVHVRVRVRVHVCVRVRVRVHVHVHVRVQARAACSLARKSALKPSKGREKPRSAKCASSSAIEADPSIWWYTSRYSGSR